MGLAECEALISSITNAARSGKEAHFLSDGRRKIFSQRFYDLEHISRWQADIDCKAMETCASKAHRAEPDSGDAALKSLFDACRCPRTAAHFWAPCIRKPAG
ncbi:hypothetical protein MPLA_1390144 [Mesorhizobium sp. ORS 3359]|nr:hypothetical protein MPLA_1390144 [Mesorhizobium sp. ORS 3359]